MAYRKITEESRYDDLNLLYRNLEQRNMELLLEHEQVKKDNEALKKQTARYKVLNKPVLFVQEGSIDNMGNLHDVYNVITINHGYIMPQVHDMRQVNV